MMCILKVLREGAAHVLLVKELIKVICLALLTKPRDHTSTTVTGKAV